MNHPDCIVCSFMESSIGLKKVNIYVSGKTPEEFKLKMVQILFRHGERLPLTKFVSAHIKGEDCYVNTSLFGNDDTLDNFLKTMTEYSGKQPPGNYLKNWKLFPNIGDAPKGSLTGIGAAQHVRLGQYIRDKYLTTSTIFSREIPLDSQM